jgi:hypothetical protein
VQYSISVGRILNDSVLCALNELPDHGLGKALLNPVTRRVIFECRYRDRFPIGRQVSGVPDDVIAAT